MTLRRRAFTLVELLVVIAIIGLLSTVAMISINSASIKARNAKRIGDIEQLANAFNLAYNVSGSFPTAGWSRISMNSAGVWAGVNDNPSVTSFIVPTYLAAKPTDPTGGNRSFVGYLYNSNWSGTSPYDGFIFQPGAYLDWSLETVSGFSCNPGHVYSSNSTTTECLMLLEK